LQLIRIRIVLLSKNLLVTIKSAELLNKLLSKTFKEEQIYHRPLSGKRNGAISWLSALETLCLSHSGTVTSLILYITVAEEVGVEDVWVL
jgi:glucose-6-phosphate 1-dehydrogenase